jgi:hypothetical protein
VVCGSTIIPRHVQVMAVEDIHTLVADIMNMRAVEE